MKFSVLTLLSGQPRKKDNPEKSTLLANLEEAKADLFRAEQDFAMASSDMVDLCTYQLKAARERCNYLLQLAKNMA